MILISLLMDEAFSALDPLIREEMQDELLNLQQKMNKTIVFITHDLNEALKIGDRIAFIRDGSLVQVGTPEEIIRDPADDYVAKFARGVDRSKILTLRDVMKRPHPVVQLRDGPHVALQGYEGTRYFQCLCRGSGQAFARAHHSGFSTRST